MTFSEAKALVEPLPASARTHRAWWANDSKVQAQAWRAAGWQVRAVDQRAERVVSGRGIRGWSYQPRQNTVNGQREAVPGSPLSRCGQ